MNRLLSLVRAKRALTITVAALLLVSLVGVAVWRQVGVRADPTRTTLVLVSAAGDPWTDDTSASGSAALTYDNAGCSAVTADGFCTGPGAWPTTIQGAHWIWETQYFQPSQAGHPATFTKTFSIPPNATAIIGQLQITADNSYDVQVNGNEVGKGNNLSVVDTYPTIGTDLHTGQNTITVTVTNLPGGDARSNPAGLYYRADVSYVPDNTAPTTAATINGQSGLNGWYRGPVTVTLAATDPDDTSGLTTSYGLDGSAPSTPYSSALTLNQDGKYILQYQSADPAGNAEATHTTNINIDQTPPALNISGAASGITYDICAGTLPTRPTYAPKDSMSGLDGSQGDSWTAPTSATGAGTYTYAAHATDMAGNSAQETRTYYVQYGAAFSGFSSPLSDTSPDGTFSLGRTIPVKFQLLCNGTPITNAVASLAVAQSGGAASNVVDASKAAPSNLFRYDSEGQQYIFNLSTGRNYTNPDGSVVSFASGAWTLTITLDDGSTYVTTITLS